jgi:pentatricopeptide repeat protein
MECPDAYAYQGVIGICIREKQLVRAADLIFDMVEEGLKPSETTFNLTLAGLVLAEVKERSTALRLIRLLPECRMLPQTWFNLMVSTKDVVEHQDFIRALLDEAIKMETKDPTARHRVIYKAIQVARTYNMTFMVTRLLKRAGELKIDIDIKTKNQLFSHMLKRGEWKLATEICNVTRPATGAQLADLLRMSTEDGSVSCAPVLVRELIKFGHKTLSPELIGLLFGKIEFPSGLTVARRIKTLLKGAKVAILPAVYMSLINRLMAAESSKPQCRALADELCSDIERASGDMSSPDLLNFLVRTRYKCRQWKKGDALYERLLRGSVSLETHTCEVIMNAQSLQRNLKEALSLFEHMRTHGPMLSPTVYSLLVAMCANNGDLKRAHELRREMQSQGVPLQWKAHAALLHCGIDDRATFRMLWADAILSLDDGDPLTLQRQERHSKSLPSLDERNETVGSAVNKMLLAFEQFNKEVGPVERDKYAHHLRGMGSIFDRLLMTETGAVSDDCIEPTAKFKAFENPR